MIKIIIYFTNYRFRIIIESTANKSNVKLFGLEARSNTISIIRYIIF